MSDRKKFKLNDFEVMIFEVEGTSYRYDECYKFAEIGNLSADIFDSIFKTRDGAYIKLTVVSAEGNHNAYGVSDGWYVARYITKDEAERIRSSWAVLREQPPAPTGPWR